MAFLEIDTSSNHTRLIRILDPIVRVLLADTVIRTIHQGTSTSAGTSDDRIMYFQAFDQKRVLYVITALANMLDNMKNSESTFQKLLFIFVVLKRNVQPS